MSDQDVYQPSIHREPPLFESEDCPPTTCYAPDQRDELMRRAAPQPDERCTVLMSNYDINQQRAEYGMEPRGASVAPVPLPEDDGLEAALVVPCPDVDLNPLEHEAPGEREPTTSDAKLEPEVLSAPQPLPPPKPRADLSAREEQVVAPDKGEQPTSCTIAPANPCPLPGDGSTKLSPQSWALLVLAFLFGMALSVAQIHGG